MALFARRPRDGLTNEQGLFQKLGFISPHDRVGRRGWPGEHMLSM